MIDPVDFMLWLAFCLAFSLGIVIVLGIISLFFPRRSRQQKSYHSNG